MAAVIFDMDGTLVDLLGVHYTAFRDAVKETTGLRFTRKDMMRGYGMTSEKIVKQFLNRRESDADCKEIVRRKREKTLKNITREQVKILPGAEKLLKDVKASGLKIALATSSNKSATYKVLEVTNLRDYFEVVISGDEVAKSKPDPQIFLETAKRLKTNPTDCAVFEDSSYGVQAGKGAGMKVVAVSTGRDSRRALSVLKPDLLVSSLSEVDVAMILNLF